MDFAWTIVAMVAVRHGGAEETSSTASRRFATRRRLGIYWRVEGSWGSGPTHLPGSTIYAGRGVESTA